MTIVVPTLSAAGWVKSPAEKADMLFSHFYESDKFQTYLYGNNISNLQYIIEQNANDLLSLVQQLRTTLEIYLGRYYDAVMVDVSVMEQQEPASTNAVTLRVYCRVNENGKDYSFGRLIEAVDSKLKQVIKLNNQEIII